MFSDSPTFQSSALEYPSYLSLQSIVHWTCSLLSPKQVSKLWASFPCLIWEGIQPFSLHLPSTPCWNKPKQENCSWLTNYFKSFPFISFTNKVSISSTIWFNNHYILWINGSYSGSLFAPSNRSFKIPFLSSLFSTCGITMSSQMFSPSLRSYIYLH